MESTSPSTDPFDAAAELARAEAMRAHLADALRLPSWFHEAIGAALALQIGTTAYALADPAPGISGVVALVVGLAVFAGVAGVQLLRFRRLNGVWVRGLAGRVVLGTSTASSLVYAASMSVAVWASMSGQWWLVVGASLAGGVGYAWSGRRWWASYRSGPEQHAGTESAAYLLGAVVLGLAGLAVLVVGRG